MIGTVAPHVGAWIEIDNYCRPKDDNKSHPTWVRGLKSRPYKGDDRNQQVAPHVGAWIEIANRNLEWNSVYVAPHVGAWIEIRATGLQQLANAVAPHVGAWIEIEDKFSRLLACKSHPTWVRGLKCNPLPFLAYHKSRTPRGCVD